MGENDDMIAFMCVKGVVLTVNDKILVGDDALIE